MCTRIPQLPTLSSLLLSLFILRAIDPASATICYTPDGSISNDMPCNPAAEVSVCCEDTFVCTENKLCQPMDWYNGTDGDPLQLIRGTCTDKTWESPECPGRCIAESPGGGEWVMRCGSGSEEYCCSDASCCKNGGKRYNLGNSSMSAIAGQQVLTTTQSSRPTSTSTSMSITTSTLTDPTPTALETDGTSPGASTNSHSKTIAIGVGVGAGCGVVILGCLLFLFWRKRKRGRDAAAQAARVADPTAHGSYMASQSGMMSEAEKAREWRVQELESQDPRSFSEQKNKARGVFEIG
ncbi:hypothetical protein FQN50_009068 [Emmonsiellopsis sp. PD_5]|nr:hypothetical protein FQN50_009068 [Emmonsiellopsis sp. PD_5]